MSEGFRTDSFTAIFRMDRVEITDNCYGRKFIIFKTECEELADIVEAWTEWRHSNADIS